VDLVEITDRGVPARPIADLPKQATEILGFSAQKYGETGYEPPWIWYLAIEDDTCVGTCAFKTPPRGQEVEIAYFTFPPHEGRGIATRMAERLIAIAREEAPGLVVTAQTLREKNASTRILTKLGFELRGEVDHPEDGLVWEWELPA